MAPGAGRERNQNAMSCHARCAADGRDERESLRVWLWAAGEIPYEKCDLKKCDWILLRNAFPISKTGFYNEFQAPTKVYTL